MPIYRRLQDMIVFGIASGSDLFGCHYELSHSEVCRKEFISQVPSDISGHLGA
jgi:hypothetical protein